MKALKFSQTGSLEHLKMVEVPDPVPKPEEVLVRVHAAAINPSDVKNVLGKFKTTLPRIPGRDFAGIVISDSPWKGKAVFGTGGTLGISTDGTHAECVTVPENALVTLPAGLSFAAAAAMGLSSVTAWQGLVLAGGLKAEERVLITGATGSVGNAAINIAHYLGAQVFGTLRSAPPSSNKAQWIKLDQEPLPEVDLVLDLVGGPMFEPCLKCLALNGRQVVIASTGDPKVCFNLLDFYHKQAHLIGVDTFKLSFAECADILKSLLPGIEKGALTPPEIDEIGLDEAVIAYDEINKGKAKRKKVIVI